MITLYRGDDTGGQLGKNVKIAFHCDDAVDMDGVTVRFNLLNVITKEWTNVHDGDILEMFVTHEQSGRLPLGFLFGKIWGEDSSGKVRTFANRLPIIVTHDLRKVYGSDGLDSQDIHVYSSVDWDAIANKPTLFPSKVDMVEGLEEALKKAGSVKTVNSVEPDGNGNIALNAKNVDAVPGFVKETGVVIPVPEEGGLIIQGKGEYYPFIFLVREDGRSVAVADLEELEEAIDTHNTNDFAHALKFAKYAPKTTVYTKTEVDDKINQFAAHIPSVSTTFTSADAGKAADAKAVGEALDGKLNSGEASLEKDAYGLTDESHVAGFFVRKNGGIFIGTAGGIVEIPYLRPGTMALDVDITDATKLTPVFDADGHVTGYKLGGKASPVLLTDDAKTALFAGAAFREAVADCFGNAETTEYGTEA